MKTNAQHPGPRAACALVVVLSLFTGHMAAAESRPLRKLSKTDGRIRMLREACRQKGSALTHLGRRAQRLVRGAGEISVNIGFERELSNAEVQEFEGRGVNFMRLPDGTVANYGRFYPAWVADSSMDTLDGDDRVEFVEAGAPLHADQPLARSVSEIQADLQHRTPSMNNPAGNRGQGVIITNFDTGIDLFHPDFFKVREGLFYNWIDADGNGQFFAGTDCVDLDRDGACSDAEVLGMAQFPFEAGRFDPQKDWLYVDENGNGQRDYGPEQFDEDTPTYGELILMARDDNGNHRLDLGELLSPLGESKIIGLLSRDDSGVGTHAYRRGIDLIDAPVDTHGHGTSVSSILVAGAAGYNRSTTGVAPDAELLVVDRYGVPNMLFAMAWARANGTDIMLWEFGGYADDYLDGSSSLEQAISEEMLENNTLQVTPNGNLANADKHAEVSLPAGGQFIQTMDVPEGLNTASMMVNILWRGGQEDDLEVAIRRTGDADFNPINLLLPATTLEDGYALIHNRSTSNRGTSQILLTLYRSPGSIEAGQWDLRLQAPDGAVDDIHMFVKDGVSLWSGGVVFTLNITDATTMTAPSTADVSLNVGSYSVKSAPGQLSYFSGRGPRIDGAQTLDITAPGHHDITCAETGAIGIWAAGRVDFGGTSAAGPHAAGAAALMMSAVPEATPQQIVDAMNDGALQDGFTGNGYNDDWGFGKLRVAPAIEALSALCPPITLSGLEPADFSAGVDPDDVVYSWDDHPNAERYTLLLGNTNPPTTLIPNLVVTSLSSGQLQPNTTYYWQVTASNACGAIASTEVMSFSTGGANAPQMHMQADQGQIDLPSASTYVFEPVEVGQFVDVTLAILNNGPQPLAMDSPLEPVAMQGDVTQFEIVQQPSPTVPPFGQRSLVVRFAPTAAGEFSADLSIETNDPDSPYRISVVGSGLVFPNMMVTYNHVDADGEPQFDDIPNDTTFSFPDTALGDDSDLIFGIRNLGQGDLELLGDPRVQIIGEHAGDFVVTLPPTDDVLFGGGGAAAAYRIAFVPTAAGVRTAEVSIPNNDPQKPSYNYTVTGVAIDLEAITDCNANGQDDGVEIDNGAAADCNANRVPDACELDSDQDGVIDDCDACPGADDGRDEDGDGIADCLDNCPQHANGDQLDTDGDGIGDACQAVDEEDEDEEQIEDCNANGQDDADDIAEGSSRDCDGDGVPDECQVDSDQDRIIDPCDVCPGEDDTADRDQDGVADCLDICPGTFDPDQVDSDADGIGDACAGFGARQPAGFCGAGSPGFMMLMMLGLCGGRLVRRRRR